MPAGYGRSADDLRLLTVQRMVAPLGLKGGTRDALSEVGFEELSIALK